MEENKHSIEYLINLDLQTFLELKNKKGSINVEDALEIAAYVGANYLRIIFNKNKEVKKEEVNGVLGIISNCYHHLFEGQLEQQDYITISEKIKTLLSDTNFDQRSKDFFLEITKEN